MNTQRDLALSIYAVACLYAVGCLLFFVILAAQNSCRPQAPATPADASDAARVTPEPIPIPPAVALDAGSTFDAAGATPDCLAACEAFVRAGCPQLPNCPAVLQGIQDGRLRRLGSGKSFTCKAAALSKTPADMRANGAGCGLSP